MFGMGVGTSMCLVRLDRRLKARGAAGEEYEKTKAEVMDVLRGHFRPEFLNRIDEVVVFHALDRQHIARIARIQLRRLQERLEDREMQLEITDEALDQLASEGFDPVFGARPLKRTIQQEVENPIARMILEGKFGENDAIKVDWKNGEFEFERA